MVDDIESDRRPMVGVVGDGTLAPGDPKEELGRRLGKELVSAGYRVACGGLSGVMRSVCGGAHASDRYREGMTVGI
ncbi:MAG: TIGR00730 family Rossman fold protein, partial [Bradymonadaceae bacterium]